MKLLGHLVNQVNFLVRKIDEILDENFFETRKDVFCHLCLNAMLNGKLIGNATDQFLRYEFPLDAGLLRVNAPISASC